MLSEQFQGVFAMSSRWKCCLHLAWGAENWVKEERVCEHAVPMGAPGYFLEPSVGQQTTDGWYQVDGGNVLIIHFASDAENSSMPRKITVN